MVISINLPEPIRGKDPGSWAYSTIVKRLPEIINRILKDNDFGSEITGQLKLLRDDLPGGTIRKLQDSQAADFGEWEMYIAPYESSTWLEVPWFFAELYFYRRIIEAVDYFQTGKDPFSHQKKQGLLQSGPSIRRFAGVLQNWITREAGKPSPEIMIQDAFLNALWGNQADLSLWPADAEDSPSHQNLKNVQDHLLADDSSDIIRLITGMEGLGRIDILLDNAGYELVSDLGLADTLLTHGLSSRIVLHVKAHPVFVSDVIEEDIRETIEVLSEDQDEAVRHFGKRLEEHFSSGRLSAAPHFFWNSPLSMRELSVDLRKDMSSSALLIIKGDANYRRLLGDLHWDWTTAFPDAVDFLPFPVAALRTLKAELAVGLKSEQIRELNIKDKEWLVNGRWGVIHFSGPSLIRRLN
ncbi:MAG: protein-glutamate O-methyltransferase family protein [Spirochaetaceae bacterium]|nr:protein-glutamate O-methyltransferase family protein [Spirochaetaceae bacterium]